MLIKNTLKEILVILKWNSFMKIFLTSWNCILSKFLLLQLWFMNYSESNTISWAINKNSKTATTKSSSRTHRNLKAQTPANIYLFKVNNKNSRKMSEICSKLIIKAPEQRYLLLSVFFTVNFEHISVHFYCYF